MRKRVLGDPARARDLASIHVAKKQLGMEDDTYRQMLWSVARVNSARDLDFAGRKSVLEHLKACGFRRTGAKAQDPQARKILALWLGLRDMGALRDASPRALDVYIERQTGAKSLRWVSSEQAAKVIEALKAWRARARRGVPEQEGEGNG